MAGAPHSQNNELTVVIDDACEELAARRLFDAAFRHVADHATGHRPGVAMIKSGSFTAYKVVVAGSQDASRPLLEQNPAVVLYRGRRQEF